MYTHMIQTNDSQTYKVALVFMNNTFCIGYCQLAPLPAFLCPALGERPLRTAPGWLLCALASSLIEVAGVQRAVGETSSAFLSSLLLSHCGRGGGCLLHGPCSYWADHFRASALIGFRCNIFSPFRSWTCHSFQQFYLLGVACSCHSDHSSASGPLLQSPQLDDFDYLICFLPGTTSN